MDESTAVRMLWLRDAIDRAYAQARSEVFDVEGATADPAHRTLRQRRLVLELDRLEQDLRDLRRSSRL